MCRFKNIRQTPLLTVFLILVFLSSLAIRIFFIFKRQPSVEEIWALLLTHSSFKDIWLGTFAELHPPFYFLFLRTLAVILPFDLNVISLRLISLFFGVLANFGVLYLGSLVLGKRIGLIIFFLSLFLPSFIWPSVFARYYSILIFLTIFEIVFFIHFVEHGRLRYLFFLAIISIIGVYTHYYFFLGLIAFGAFLFLVKRYRFLLKKWILLIVSVSISFAPGLFYLLTLPKPEAIWITNSLLKIPAVLLVNFISWALLLFLYYYIHPLIYLPITAALFISSVILLIYGLRKWQSEFWILFLAVIFIPAILPILLSYTIRPLFGVGSLIIFSPVFLIVVAKGISFDLQKSKILTSIFIVTVFLSVIFFFQFSSLDPPERGPLAFVASEFRKGDLVLHANLYSFIPARYYLGDKVNFGIVPTISSAPQTERALGYKVVSLKSILEHKGRVWYIEPGFEHRDEIRSIKAQLDKNLLLVKEKKFPAVDIKFPDTLYNIYLYATKLD